VTTWVLDLDGVVWLGSRAIPGSADAVAALRGAGHRVAFCTNNSSRTVDDYVEKLGGAGLPAKPDDVLTSAQAAALLVEEGERVMAVADEGVREALRRRGAVVVDPYDGGDVDAVMVGYWRGFDYAAMDAASRAVLGGARFLATNTDPRYPHETGFSPGCGSIVASIATATGCSPEVAGKPHDAMVRLVRARCGDVGVVVGDTPETDGALAAALGWSFGLVLTGNTSPTDVPAGLDPEWVGPDLADLVARLGR
jgi:HAD superfamily hydrolase (TIGR01450 family)